VGGPRFAKLTSYVLSPLLQVCSPNVVTQFARIAHESGFLFVYHIIASNNRTSAAPSSFSSSLPPGGNLTTSVHQHAFLSANGKLPAPQPRQERDATRPEAVEEADLDSFFPFDPFRLPTSAKYIDAIYRSWEGPEDSDSDDDDDDEEEDEDERADTFSTEPINAIPGKRRRMRLSAGADAEGDVAELGRSFEQGLSMSVSPGLGIAGRMGVVA
jgi:RNA polymerase I-specific transcription initiation factor RRN3